MIMAKIIGLVVAWLFFYKVLKSRNKRIPGIKATIITLLFASLVFRFSTDLYSLIDKNIFTLNGQDEIPLIASPLKIPSNETQNYCNQFTDQNNKVIQTISERADGKYCGEFWKFKTEQNLMLPYKILNSTQIMYWASPTLRIIGAKENLEKSLNTDLNKK